ncbi:MAG: GNAT family N-acetyltransferase [Limisphaerales bacterium]
MVSVEVSFRRTKLFKAYHKWFAGKPNPADRLKFVYYYHCHSTDEARGFERERKFTKLIDVTQDEDKIFANFSKTSRYEVRRAGKEKLDFGVITDKAVFEKFYNEFAAAKDLGQMDEMFLNAYWPHMKVTSMGRDGEPFVMHAYVVDEKLGRLNLSHSASGFRGMYDKELRRLYGRANRLLHFEDMKWACREGYRCYDFGGYALETKDKSLAAVNEFKDSFGGELVEESSFTSTGLKQFRRVKRLFGRD